MSKEYWKSCTDCRGVKNLNKFITIKKPFNKVSNNINTTSHSREYVDQGKIWADIITKNGVELIEESGITKIETHRFICRYSSISKLIDNDHFIEYRSVLYKIDSITNVDEQNAWIVIKAHVKGRAAVQRNL